MDDPRAWVLLGATFLLGSSIGSFLNVVAYRLPRECMSIARGRSHCPACAQAIATRDNLPLLGWILLGGRARCCGARISPRYPLVELATGLLFVHLAWHFVPAEGLGNPAQAGQAWLSTLVAMVVVATLVALSLIDADHRILPNELTFGGMVLGPLFAFVAPVVQHGRPLFRGESLGWWQEHARLDAALSGLLGGVVAAGILWGIGWLGSKAFRKPAMGLGDVKMIGAMGAMLGGWALLALGVATLAGAVLGITFKLLRPVRYMPFGPFLAIGTWSVMLYGPEILAAYLGLAHLFTG